MGQGRSAQFQREVTVLKQSVVPQCRWERELVGWPRMASLFVRHLAPPMCLCLVCSNLGVMCSLIQDSGKLERRPSLRPSLRTHEKKRQKNNRSKIRTGTIHLSLWVHPSLPNSEPFHREVGNDMLDSIVVKHRACKFSDYHCRLHTDYL